MDLITAAGKAHLTYEEALAAMGAKGGESPDELKKIFRDKMRKMHPDLPENRGQDMAQAALDLNAAYDILRGEAKPAAYDFRSPPSGKGPVRDDPPPGTGYDDWGGGGGGPRTQTNWTPPEQKRVTFEEARAAGKVPFDVEWKFVTDSQRSKGYSSDEFTNLKTSWVAYGIWSGKHVFVIMVHSIRQDHFVGGARDSDEWAMLRNDFPIKKDEGSDPAWLHRKVVDTLSLLQGEFAFGGRFNSKVIDAQGWKFGERMPVGRETSIKHWLVNSGAVAADAPAVSGRKQVVELEVESDRLYGGSSVKPGFYPEPKSRYNDYSFREDGSYSGEYWKLTLVLNGKNVELGEADVTKFMGMRMGGDRLVNAIFGQYIYSKSRKVLTRLRKGKEIMAWMAEDLKGLPPDAKAVLEAAAAQMKGAAA